jgi:hypothetical protein
VIIWASREKQALFMSPSDIDIYTISGVACYRLRRLAVRVRLLGTHGRERAAEASSAALEVGETAAGTGPLGGRDLGCADADFAGQVIGFGVLGAQMLHEAVTAGPYFIATFFLARPDDGLIMRAKMFHQIL